MRCLLQIFLIKVCDLSRREWRKMGRWMRQRISGDNDPLYKAHANSLRLNQQSQGVAGGGPLCIYRTLVSYLQGTPGCGNVAPCFMYLRLRTLVSLLACLACVTSIAYLCFTLSHSVLLCFAVFHRSLFFSNES